MKKTLVMLSGLLLLSSTAMAGGVASRSLSRVIAYDNPAAQTFTIMQYEIAVGKQISKYAPSTGTVEFDISYYQAGAKFDSIFAGVQGYKTELKTGGATSVIADRITASLGWAWEDFSLAAYQMTDNNAVPSENFIGIGLDWRLAEKFYLGLTQDNGPDSLKNQKAGLAFKLDKQFRIELSKDARDDGFGNTNSITTVDAIEVEVQWMNFVVGHISQKSSDAGSSASSTVTRSYLAWEPEKGGFLASIAMVGGTVADFDSGTEARIGYSF